MSQTNFIINKLFIIILILTSICISKKIKYSPLFKQDEMSLFTSTIRYTFIK